MNKRIMMLLFLGLFVILVGCSNAKVDQPAKTSPAPVVVTEQSIDIYTISTEEMIVAPLKVPVKKAQLSAKEVAQLVVENLDETVQLYKVVQKGDTVTVSFSDIGAPTQGCSAEVESMILQCFANSLLDNVKDCKQIVFGCNEEAYEGGHFSFGKDEVYSSN